MKQSDNYIKTLGLLTTMTPHYKGSPSSQIVKLQPRLQKAVANYQRYQHDPERFLRKIGYLFDNRIYPIVKDWLLHGLGAMPAFQYIDFSNPIHLQHRIKQLRDSSKQYHRTCSFFNFLLKNKKERHMQCWSMAKSKSTFLIPYADYDILQNSDFVEYCHQQRSHPENPEWEGFFVKYMQEKPKTVLSWLGAYYLQRQHMEPAEAWHQLKELESSYITLKEIDKTIKWYDIIQQYKGPQNECPLWI